MVAPTPGGTEGGTAGGTAGGPRRAVYLHVGAAKSGTSFLQDVLWQNRGRLREHGVLFPGADFSAQVRAAFDLRRTFFPEASDPWTRDAWRDLVDEVRAWPGNAVISQELFAPASPADVRRAMADLGFADVHLVFTARDLGRQIPAHWQEDVKNRFTTSFTEFVAALRRRSWRTFESARLFWGLQDPVAVLRRWGAGLPPERVHVVTLPPPGAPRDLLWRRFCAATGLVPDEYDLSGTFANPSLGLTETQFLLRLNAALGERIGWHAYNDEVKLFLAQHVLAGRPAPVRIELPAEHLPWATERAVEMAEGLRAAGYHVVGDLYELMPMAASGPALGTPPAPDPDEPRWAEMADVGVDAVAALLARVRERHEHAASVPGAEMPVRDRIGPLRRDAAALAEETARMARDAAPFAARAARAAGDRYPAVRRLRGAYPRWRGAAAPSDAETRTTR
ncbi:hypothetical protein [Actinomadura geliboluensis]|uniref:hypothetical protein n=1 Tax=Actinomadura geliboluensis TaxID=882440 RepID=UPI003692FF3C